MFRHPLYLLWLPPALAACLLAYARGASRRRKLTALMGHPATLSRLMPAETAGRRRLQALLRAAGLCSLFVALSGPQWGVELAETQAAAHQVLLLVDTSLSMSAEDVKPSRLEKAKRELATLLDQFKGGRVGIIAFAGEAGVVCPLTTDIDAAKQILQSLEPGMIPTPGTAIGKAISLATATLRRYSGTKNLVLLTDGEDHHSDPLGAADEAAADGVRIFAIGIGTPEGEPIPLKEGGSLTGYKKDRKGITVVSKLGERTLNDLAARTHGAYFRASPGENEAAEIAQAILKTGKTEGLTGATHQFKNRFMPPLALAFLLLLAELLLPERAGARALTKRNDTIGSVPAAAAIIALLTVPHTPVHAATAEGALRKGNRLYNREQYVPALEAYSQAGRKRPDDPRPVFNAGDSLYRLEQYDKAALAFKAIAESKGPAALRADAYYNLGNIHSQNERWKEAVESYRKAVSLNPADKDARNNLAVALRRLKNPQPKRNKQDQNKPKDKPQEQGKKDQSQKDKSGSPPPPAPKTRPEDQISREDAERILRAVAEREKSMRLELQKRAPAKPPQVEEDW